MFNPDPKPEKVEREIDYSINNPTKIKKYKCRICKNTYEKMVGDIKRKWCSNQCKVDYALKVYLKQKKEREKAQNKQWRERKAKIKEDLGVKPKKNNNEPLQASINAIARELDKDKSCIVFPFSGNWKDKDAGHILSIGSNPTLRYLLLNIHGEGKGSNMNQNIKDTQRIDGACVRYGNEFKDWLEWCRRENKSINLNNTEKMEKLKIANGILRELKKGKVYKRSEIDKKIGIYKLPEGYKI